MATSKKKTNPRNVGNSIPFYPHNRMPPQKKPLKLEPKGDIKELKKLFDKSKVVILVVFANWCGHCQTMKKNIWDPLCKRKDVNVENVAAVESSVLEGANEKEILEKVEGYPTVLKIKNGRPVESIPLPSTVDEMKTLVQNAKEESEAVETAPFQQTNQRVATPYPQTNMNERAATLKQVNRNNSLTTLVEPTSYTPEENPLAKMEAEQKEIEKQRMTGGGMLYDTMRQISSGILPAGLLGFTALAMRGGRRKTKKVRKAKKVKKTRKH